MGGWLDEVLGELGVLSFVFKLCECERVSSLGLKVRYDMERWKRFYVRAMVWRIPHSNICCVVVVLCRREIVFLMGTVLVMRIWACLAG